MGNPVRLGLIGAGSWGRNYIKTIKGVENAILTWLVSQNPKSRLLVDPSCTILSDWRTLLNKKDIDGVIIATSALLHAEIAIAALSSGISVMVEKPLALSLDEAIHIEKAVQKSGLLVLVDHTYLFHPAFEMLKQKAKDFGKITFVETAGWNWGPFREGISPLWDWGPHDVAMCLDLFGVFPERIEAREVESKDFPQGKGQIVNMRLEFPQGVIANITVGNMYSPKMRHFVVGFGENVLIFDDLSEKQLVLRNRNEEISIEVSPKPPLTQAVETFVWAIKGKSDPRVGISLGVDVIRVLDSVEVLFKRIRK